MLVNDLNSLGITELSSLIYSRETTCKELVETCLERADTLNEALNAFVFIDQDQAIEQANQLDSLLERGKWYGPLHGIPIAVKDNYLVNGMQATACSKTMSNKAGTLDSTVVAKLRAAGAIILGKTNMHEWAYGATNEISSAGSVKNPWGVKHISAGSSGGSAVAVSAQMVPVALGSDTGGSIRMPSAACGVCGLKPTYGYVSTEGVLPLSWSMDVAGPIARSVEDLSILYSLIKEKTNSEVKKFNNYQGLEKLSILLPEGRRLEYSDEVGKVFNAAMDMLRSNGARTNSMLFENMIEGFAAWNIILHVEATTYHSETMRENADGFSDDIRNHLEAGNYIPATSYLKAHQYRDFFNKGIEQVFAKNHIIAMPTLPVTAPLIGQQTVSFSDVKVSSQDAMTYLAWFANFTGLPALTIPCGIAENGMPVGMSLIGPAGSDEMLLEIGCAIQSISDWHKVRPEIENGLGD